MVILTDLSDVLIHGLYEIEGIFAERYDRNVARIFGQRHLETEEDFNELMRGKMREDDYWRLFMQGYSWPCDIQEIKSVFSENLRKTVPGTLNVYRRIIAYPRSFRRMHSIIEGKPEIYIVSDHIKERSSEIHDYHPDIFALAEGEFWSYEFGHVKKDDSFFPRLIRFLNVPLDEIIFVDDSAYNTTSATLAGITSVYFEDANQLENNLRQYGFKFAPSV